MTFSVGVSSALREGFGEGLKEGFGEGLREEVRHAVDGARVRRVRARWVQVSAQSCSSNCWMSAKEATSPVRVDGHVCVRERGREIDRNRERERGKPAESPLSLTHTHLSHSL